MRITAAISIFALIGLSACGRTVGEQALIGAGAGTVAAAAVGGSLAAGAIVGGAANAIYCQEFATNC
jgi:hypothetical protein